VITVAGDRQGAAYLFAIPVHRMYTFQHRICRQPPTPAMAPTVPPRAGQDWTARDGERKCRCTSETEFAFLVIRSPKLLIRRIEREKRYSGGLTKQDLSQFRGQAGARAPDRIQPINFPNSGGTGGRRRSGTIRSHFFQHHGIVSSATFIARNDQPKRYLRGVICKIGIDVGKKFDRRLLTARDA